MMSRFFLLTLALTYWSASAFGQLTDKDTYYHTGQYEYGGVTMPYRELDVCQEKDGLSALVVQLHGGTARGDDNQSQLDAAAVDSVEAYLREHQMKAFFLLPQCGADRLWNESVRSQPVPMSVVVAQWLRDFIASHDIDANRVYLTGYSAGGSGSWRLLNDEPSLFAAACIAAATPLMVTAEKVKSTPVYAIAGTADNIMDATKIQDFVASIVALGGEARCDLLEGKDHFGTCNDAFTEERLGWMFAHPCQSQEEENQVQTLEVYMGGVVYQIPAAQAGMMSYIHGETLRILDMDYRIAEIDSIVVKNVSVEANTVKVVYEGTHAKVFVSGNIASQLALSVRNADVSITQAPTVSEELTYRLSGKSGDGSFVLDGEYKVTLSLEGLDLTNQRGAAVNILNGKRISICLPDGTESRLADGNIGEQKACLMVNGHSEFQGGGTLVLTGNKKHAFWGDEYVLLKEGAGQIVVNNSVKDAFSINQYFEMRGGNVVIKQSGDDGIQVDKTADDGDGNNGNIIISGGTLTANITAAAAKGLKAEGDMTVSGGTIDIETTGDGLWDDEEMDTSASACIKADGDIHVSGGSLTLTSTGTGGKGINVDGALVVDDSDIHITTTGARYVYEGYEGEQNDIPDNYKSSPKGITVGNGIVVNGGLVRVSTAEDGGEGLESKTTLDIYGGDIEIESYDDGINSKGDMAILGGRIYANSADNDGIDSNANLFIRGGTIVAYGSSLHELGIDVNDRGTKKLYVSGGALVAFGGSTGVSRPYTSDDAQPTIIYMGQVEQGNTLMLSTGGTPVLAATQQRDYTAENGGTAPRLMVMMSMPSLTVGDGYVLYGGSAVKGDDWHGFYPSPELQGRGTQLGRVTSLASPYSNVR